MVVTLLMWEALTVRISYAAAFSKRTERVPQILPLARVEHVVLQVFHILLGLSEVLLELLY